MSVTATRSASNSVTQHHHQQAAEHDPKPASSSSTSSTQSSSSSNSTSNPQNHVATANGSTPAGQTLTVLNQQTPALRAHFTTPKPEAQATPAAAGAAAGAAANPLAQQTPPPGGTVTRSGNSVTIETGNQDDRVNVSRDAATGDVTVNVNGTDHRFKANEAEHITIRTHGGNDVVDVAPDMQNNFTIEGGEGNDIIAGGAGADKIDGGAGNDTLIGGKGSDEIKGGAGDDKISDSVGLLDADVWTKGIGLREGGGNDTVRAGDGNDTVNTGDGNDTVYGGDGNDTLNTGDGDDKVYGGVGDDKIDAGEGQDRVWGGAGNDRIQAGAGHDHVDGGSGDDYIDGSTGHDQLYGRSGADTVYGGEGDDIVDGGAGKDYLDGYLGNDLIRGGDGDDVMSGGQGDDTMVGEKGNDVIYTGKGKDFVGDYDGTNTVYHQAEDNLFVNHATRNNANTRVVEVADVPDNIRIEGSPEFQARMRADLETLAASPTGQHMLREIDRQGDGWRIFGGDNHLTITELGIENGRGGGTFGGDGFAEINPAFHLDDDDGRVPPITVLYHELGHARAAMSDNWADGTFQDNADPTNPDIGIDNSERQATGLPLDHDNDPSTPAVIHPDTPAELTENAIRAEMGYGPRLDYR